MIRFTLAISGLIVALFVGFIVWAETAPSRMRCEQQKLTSGESFTVCRRR